MPAVNNPHEYAPGLVLGRIAVRRQQPEYAGAPQKIVALSNKRGRWMRRRTQFIRASYARVVQWVQRRQAFPGSII